MSDMVERVAIAINESVFGKAMDADERSRKMARAAIKAMREPTDRMVAEGEETIFEDRPHAEEWQIGATREGYQAMIDAALDGK